MKALVLFATGVAVGWWLAYEAARRHASGVDCAYKVATVPLGVSGNTWTDGSTTWFVPSGAWRAGLRQGAVCGSCEQCD